MRETVSVYDQLGGMPYFEALVDRFYDGVEQDEVLAPLYPEAPDFTGARHRLTLFLAQYWGGPTTYNEQRGHPMLRARHIDYPIGPLQRDRWLVHMTAALEAVGTPDDLRQEQLAYFVRAAEHLRNDERRPDPRFQLIPPD